MQKGFILFLIFFWFFYPIEVVRVIDGDTLIADIDLGFNREWKSVRIRAAGYDAFDKPLEKKLKAKSIFEKFLLKTPIILITEGKMDLFGRVVGYLENSDENLSHHFMINSGMTTGSFENLNKEPPKVIKRE